MQIYSNSIAIINSLHFIFPFGTSLAVDRFILFISFHTEIAVYVNISNILNPITLIRRWLLIHIHIHIRYITMYSR